MPDSEWPLNRPRLGGEQEGSTRTHLRILHHCPRPKAPIAIFSIPDLHEFFNIVKCLNDTAAAPE